MATVNDVTELAELEIGSLDDHGAELSMGDTLMLTRRLLEKRATEEGVALRIIAPESGCEAACDAGRLRMAGSISIRWRPATALRPLMLPG
jgi:hypothetical protein